MKKWISIVILFTLVMPTLFLKEVVIAASAEKGNDLNAAVTTTNTFKQFKDVPSSHWAAVAIQKAASQGFMSGYPDGRFRPSGTISRAEFTAVLVRIMGLGTETSNIFNDINNHWAANAIQRATAAGIITMADFGSAFKPNQAITRLEMAKMMANALAKDNKFKTYLNAFKGLYNGDLPFVDYRDIKENDVPYLALIIGAKVMGGYSDASFGLNQNATRAEAAVIFEKFHTNKAKTPSSFQYLEELKEVAETGMNAMAVSQLIPKVNLIADEIVTDHSNYTAKLKRLYVLPLKGDKVSMFERKYLWDRNIYPKNYFDGATGYLIGVLDIAFKKDGPRSLFNQNLFLHPTSAFYFQDPYDHFGFTFPYMKPLYEVKKDKKDEIVLYGLYGYESEPLVRLDSYNAKKGSSYELMLIPESERSKK